MPTSFTHDVIIIGQGLAGTVLSETLAQRGKRVMVFDAPRPGRASHVAAGLVNPVSLRRTVLTWRASEMLAIAGAFYRDLGLQYDTAFWHPTPLAVLFPTAQEAGIWQLRMKDPEMMRFLRLDTSADPALDQLPQPYGRGIIDRSAWVDVSKMLEAYRAQALAAGELEERSIEASDIRRSDDGVELLGRTAPLLVHCSGPFAQVDGLVQVKGEGLTVRIPDLHATKAIHRGVFMLPVGDEVYRVGSTFAWNDVWSGPSADAQRYLLDRLERLVEREVEVLDHWCGVRPASKDRRPILGRVGRHEVVFNGLGSRGVVLAPWCAQHLCDHVFEGAELDEAVRPDRFIG
ncbi:MAG: FAD-dependent oxidoreductase [Flavobacteriales bacterium]|nr:FAD-dependent oxidoreductase [Flavobacteriales bacterium]